MHNAFLICAFIIAVLGTIPGANLNKSVINVRNRVRLDRKALLLTIKNCNYASDRTVFPFNVRSDLQLTQGRSYVKSPIIVTYTRCHFKVTIFEVKKM